MAKSPKQPNRPTGGKHITKRANIGVPHDWHAVLRKLAAKKKQPVLWYILEIAKAQADQEGIPTPTPPWEDQP